jgi:hypothetical protein
MCLRLENLHENVDNNMAWNAIRENIRASGKDSLLYYELKRHIS